MKLKNILENRGEFKPTMVNLMGNKFTKDWEDNATKLVKVQLSGLYKIYSNKFLYKLWEVGAKMSLSNFDGNPTELRKMFSDLDSEISSLKIKAMELFSLDYINSLVEKNGNIDELVWDARQLVGQLYDKLKSKKMI